MSKNKYFQRRIEIINDCLRNNMRKWTVKDLQAAVSQKLQGDYAGDVSIRTLYEDLNYMRFELDAPIQDYWENRRKYYRYTNPNYSIRQVPIRPDEIELLKDAVDILRQVSGIQLFEEVSSIINKLESTIATNAENRCDFIQFERNDQVLGTQWITDCFDAIRGKTVLEISYKPYFREEKKHVVHPYLLKEFRNRWFLIGRTGEHKRPTTFALDRIMKLKPLKQRFLENDLFDPSTYYDHVVGITMVEGAAPIEVKLKLSADRVPYVITKPLHPSQAIVKQLRNGSAVITMQVVDNFELRAMLLGFGPAVEVISPKTIRDALRQMHEAAAKVNV